MMIKIVILNILGFKFWTSQPDFLDVVKQVWDTDIKGNTMWRLQSKLKLLSKRLSAWSKENIGDINKEVNSWEAKLLVLEDEDLNNNNSQSKKELNKGYAKYTRWLGLQDSLLKQKAQIKWFKEEDFNTKYFHNILRDRRRRMYIHKIKNHKDMWIQRDEKIARAGTKNFKIFFNLKQPISNLDITNCIPNLITNQDNDFLTKIPDEKEVHDAVFSMSKGNSAWPDGFNGSFYQTCWSIIKEDIMKFVTTYFKDKNLTKFYSHTCLALIPKVESPSRISDFRTINLSNYTNKIISKIIMRRVNPMLNRFITENQSGFVSGRLITENVMLSQEIIHDIAKPNKGGNVVVKLDMAKAYDRLFWTFLYEILDMFGFSPNFIDIIKRIIFNIFYSVIINGT